MLSAARYLSAMQSRIPDRSGRNGAMDRKPGWPILFTRDVRAAMDFYRVAAGWRFEPLPDTTSYFVGHEAGGEPVAIFVDASGSDFPDAPELWLPYFRLDDLDRCVLEAEKLGATVLRAPFELTGLGRVALLRQPGGSIVGWRGASSAAPGADLA